MCGIWGLVTIDKNFIINNDNLYKLFMQIKHRGPDRSIYIDNSTYKIGFHRLAIIDTTIQGDQPFSFSYYKTNEDGDQILRTLYVICNGEIYNYKEILESDEFTESLIKTNYKLKSQSDCEILLPLFIHYGIERMIIKLNGEFAFAIYDIEENITKSVCTYNLYMGRDRFGIRPLFYTIIDDKTIGFCSEMKGLIDIQANNVNNLIKVFAPREWMHLSGRFGDDKFKINSNNYYQVGNVHTVLKPDLDDVYRIIQQTFTTAVKIRLNSDRELGCLLSGGLDSSLVAAIASKCLKEQGRKLRTFSIGMKNSPDSYYAKMVADHIGSIHTNIEIPEEEWLNNLYNVIKITETFDITTIRATTGQYLISKWIRANTNIKVLLIGDGSDELTAGYLYFHKAPSPNDSHFENIRLLSDIHYFDVLRADRGVASNGLEARVPFLDYKFVDLYLSIDPILRIPTMYNYTDVNGNNVKISKCEKWLLRKSFEQTNLLPLEVLWRKKEAFSDGVSSQEKSWYQIIQANINNSITDDYVKANIEKYNGFVIPHTKEALHYHQIYDKMYPNQYGICPYYWLPKWIANATDPSARTLEIYNQIDSAK